jgi:hypothetical protein
MLALHNFLPLYCASSGTPTRLDRVDNPLVSKFKAKQTGSCAICGVMYQLVDKSDLLRAATASGGDLVFCSITKFALFVYSFGRI